MQDTSYFVHSSAVIDAGASIGAGSKVWHFTHIMSSSAIGENCIIGQNVFIDRKVKIGNGVKIQNNVSVYQGVTLEDDVFLGPSMVFTNVINPRSFIERKTEFRPTLVCRGATIGANATILCGIEVGEYALIGAGAVVTRTVPPFALITGNPGKRTGWVSKAGITLEFNDKGEAYCPESGEKYQLAGEAVIHVLPSPGQKG
ncbi:acyltransferase [Terrimonas ferruginea]|uniref:acyltransferase n=1 Tax=Terrimonas ferruginea TaxID=249 RepID=UPI00048B8747|nr:acyltransferase [Terrimonas ferruginea]